MATTGTFRHAKTGIVRDYPTSIARRFPDLIEVAPGTKPLAYTPIPRSVIDEYLAANAPSAVDEQDAPNIDTDEKD